MLSNVMLTVSVTDFEMPCEFTVEVINPHCLNVKWKKDAGPVTGYKVYCFPGDSKKPEIIHELQDVNQQSTIISGLKPGTMYRVEITSVSSGSESKPVLIKGSYTMRRSPVVYNSDFFLFLMLNFKRVYRMECKDTLML